MSKSRTELQALLENLLGSPEVYFQPPASVRMKYPAIVYSLSGITDWEADDKPYIHNKSYQVTLIDKDPDSVYSDKLLELPLCSFERAFASDNLNHFVYRIFF